MGDKHGTKAKNADWAVQITHKQTALTGRHKLLKSEKQ
jgi:hypothetical protein